jgi:hypothetical protein
MAYAKTAKVPYAITESPVASPSRPSVMFTALLVPVRMNVTNSTYSHANAALSGTTSTYL